MSHTLEINLSSKICKLCIQKNKNKCLENKIIETAKKDFLSFLVNFIEFNLSLDSTPALCLAPPSTN